MTGLKLRGENAELDVNLLESKVLDDEGAD